MRRYVAEQAEPTWHSKAAVACGRESVVVIGMGPPMDGRRRSETSAGKARGLRHVAVFAYGF